MGMNRANLCWRSEARDSKAAGRWNTREETAAHRNTPYHISGKTQLYSYASLHAKSVNILHNHECIYLIYFHRGDSGSLKKT